MSAIHKFSPQRLGPGEVPGRPRTLCLDGIGCIGVYYESGPTQEFILAFTGDEVPDGFEITDSLHHDRLVYHLLTRPA